MSSVSQTPTVTGYMGGASSSSIQRITGFPSRGASLTGYQSCMMARSRLKNLTLPLPDQLDPATLCLQLMNAGLDPPVHCVHELHGVTGRTLIGIISPPECFPHFGHLLLDVARAHSIGHGSSSLSNGVDDPLNPRSLLFL